MILTVDIGNSTLMLGGFEKDALTFVGSMHADPAKTADEYAIRFSQLLALHGIDKSEMIAVGDQTNDLPMIEYAGLGVAMGNAPEEVKLRADAVTESVLNDGVAVMIEKYVL